MDALAEAVRSAIKERTAIAERPVFFVSGGADLRVMLFCTRDRSRVVGINLYEREANETQVARKLCEVAGCDFVAIQRDSDFYSTLYPRSCIGPVPCGRPRIATNLDSSDRVAEYSSDLVMTACTTDWIFKGYDLKKVSFSFRALFALPRLHQRTGGWLSAEHTFAGAVSICRGRTGTNVPVV